MERYRTRPYQIVIKIANKNYVLQRTSSRKVTGFYEYLAVFSISVPYNVHRAMSVKDIALQAGRS
jgi:hypothetical protein